MADDRTDRTPAREADGASARRRARNPRIEVLRLVAILGVVVFHTFQPWFASATAGTLDAGPAGLLALGLVSLLGAYGNHVFFMISGFFLVPRAARGSADGHISSPETLRAPTATGYWRDQARRTGRRALVIALSVGVYALLGLLLNAWVAPVSAVSAQNASWALGGLEFIWVYLVLVLASPVIGWLWRRIPGRRAVVCALVVAVFALNAYIAFVSPGGAERGLLEWRKLMSAASYLVAFLAGAALAESRRERAPLALALAVAASVLAEGFAALTSDLGLLAALSFKSTSALSFALAAASVAVAAGRAGASGAGRPASPLRGRLGRGATSLAASILGVYITHTLFSPLRLAVQDAFTLPAAALGTGALLGAGVAASVLLLAGSLLADRILRLPLLRRLRLA